MLNQQRLTEDISIFQEQNPIVQEKERKHNVLTQVQIDYAKKQIKEMHIIEDTPITVVYPWLNYVNCCSKKKSSQLEDKNITEPLLTESQLEANHRKSNLNPDLAVSDPLMQLGFGIVAYRNMMWLLILAFSLFSCLAIPACLIYKNGDGFSVGLKELKGYEVYSLGNLGYSTVQCQQIPVGIGILTLECPYGTIGSILDYGVNNVNQSINGKYCQNSASNIDCMPTNPNVAAQLNSAVGSAMFSFEFDPNSLWMGVQTTCDSNQNPIFVQYTCVQTQAQQQAKYKQLNLITFFGILTCCLFTVLTRWLYLQGKINAIEWDVATITAGDYTVEMKIVSGAFQNWWTQVYKKENTGDFYKEIPSAISLKKYMIRTIEELLTKDWDHMRNKYNPALSTKELEQVAHLKAQDKARGKKVKEIKVADINFAFNNQKMVKLMRKRGSAIVNHDFKKVKKIEEKIQVMLKNDVQKLATPTAAFITFEEEHGKYLALKRQEEWEKMNNTVEILPGQYFAQHLKAASEPSDIIWENRHLTYWGRMKRAFIAYGSVIIILLLSFYFIFYVAQQELKVARVFPTANCAQIDQTYGEQLGTYAYYDYLFVKNNPGQESSGCLQCYCYQQYNEFGFTYTDNELYGPTNVRMCGEFYELVVKVEFFKNALSIGLSIFNVLLRYLVIFAVTWIGYETKTMELQNVTLVTFICQFFNTAFLLLLVNANLEEQPFVPLIGFDKGTYGDFNPDFFKTIGNTLISTMIYNAIYPLLEFAGFLAMRLFFRCKDRGFGLDRNKTKKTSVQAYINLYSGPAYEMHYKYSTILNISFVTLMFGFGMPILFPLAIFALFILYMTEKTMLYYSYKNPPMYDQRLSEMVLRIMQVAPIFYLAFGYWMCSNRQLLSNDYLTPVATTASCMTTHHTWVQIFSAEGWSAPAWPLITMTLIFVLIYWVAPLFHFTLEQLFPSYIIGDLEIEEKIDNYFSSLDENDRNWSIKEEQNSRNLLKTGLQMMTDEQFASLKASKPTQTGKFILGAHSYDMLANNNYYTDFQYVSVSVPDRHMYIIDDDDDESNDEAQSNIVRVAMNLGYIFTSHKNPWVIDKNTFTISRLDVVKDHVNFLMKSAMLENNI